MTAPERINKVTEHSMDGRIDEAIAYVETLSPGFTARIRGSSPELIDRLEELVGVPLPRSYRRLLERMGDHHGGLSLVFDCVTTTRGIIDFYETDLHCGDVTLPAGSIAIGVAGLGIEECVLKLRDPLEPTVHANEEGAFGWMVAGSLAGLIAQDGFSQFGDLRSLVMLMADRSSAEHFKEARSIAIANGFVPEWFSDEQTLCAIRPGATLHISLTAGSLSVAITSATFEDSHRLMEPFEGKLGLVQRPA